MVVRDAKVVVKMDAVVVVRIHVPRHVEVNAKVLAEKLVDMIAKVPAEVLVVFLCVHPNVFSGVYHPVRPFAAVLVLDYVKALVEDPVEADATVQHIFSTFIWKSSTYL